MHNHGILKMILKKNYISLARTFLEPGEAYLTRFGEKENSGARGLDHICGNTEFQRGVITGGVDVLIALSMISTDHCLVFIDAAVGLQSCIMDYTEKMVYAYSKVIDIPMTQIGIKHPTIDEKCFRDSTYEDKENSTKHYRMSVKTMKHYAFWHQLKQLLTKSKN